MTNGNKKRKPRLSPLAKNPTNSNAIVSSLFMIRYELFQKGFFTHVTSNYHPKDLGFESVIMDRINEMFNFIEFKGDSFRR